MKVTIFGVGAIGGHLAARLGDRTGHDLSVVARGETLAAIMRDGVSLTWRDGTVQQARPRGVGDADQLPVQDVVIVALKAPALPAAATDIGALIGPDTFVAFVLNGIPWWYDARISRLDPTGSLLHTIPLDRCVAVVAYSANEVLKPGQVATHTSSGDRYLVGRCSDEGLRAAQAVSALLNEAEIDAPLCMDIKPIIWRKLMMNTAFSGVSALARQRVGDACQDPELARLIRAVAQDVHRVASALSINIDPISDVEWEAISRSTHRSSLLQDLELDRATEIDAMFQAPLDLAEQYNLEVPALRIVTALLAVRARRCC